MARSKQSWIWSACNLFMALLVIGAIAYMYTYEVDYMQKVINETSSGEGWDALGMGIGAAVVLVFSIPAAIIYAASGILLLISGIGLMSSGRRGYVILGSVGKFLTFLPSLWMIFLTTSFMNPVSFVLYGLIGAGYIAGGIVDLTQKKRLPKKEKTPVVAYEEATLA